MLTVQLLAWLPPLVSLLFTFEEPEPPVVTPVVPPAAPDAVVEPVSAMLPLGSAPADATAPEPP